MPFADIDLDDKAMFEQLGAKAQYCIREGMPLPDDFTSLEG